MDLTTLVSGHLRYLGLGSPLIGEFNSIELQAPVWRLGKERQLAQQGGAAAGEREAMRRRVGREYEMRAGPGERQLRLNMTSAAGLV